MPAKSKFNKAQMLKLVKESIKKWNPDDGEFKVEVIDKDVKKREDWWYVPVFPKPNPKRTYHFHDVLADVATELEDKRHLFVQFIPTYKN